MHPQVMLQTLKITNLALIETAQLNFRSGLTALTGESGSGKSVLLDALALVRGDMRPRITVRNGSLSGLVEAEFTPARHNDGSLCNRALTHALDDAGLLTAFEPGESLVLARRLEKSGRSRCFVQGQTVSRAALTSIASTLLELTSQGEAHALKSKRAQLLAVDQFGGLAPKRTKVETSVRKLKTLESELEENRKHLSEAEIRRDFLEFQIDELRQCDVSLVDERRARSAQLERAEKDRLAHREVLDCTKYGSDALIARLNWLLCRLPEGAKESPASQVAEKVNRALEEIESASQISEAEVGSSDRDQVELEELRKGLSALDALAAKHRIDASDLPQKLKRLLDEQDEAVNIESQAQRLLADVQAARDSATELAEGLHEARVKSSLRLERRLKKELRSVGLEDARIEVRLSQSELTITGITNLEFAFSANSGQELAPLSRVASGGELSRVLLCFRLATDPTDALMSFDEIDSGAGGKTAEKIAQALLRASEHGQVLCVTHWPQVAGAATSQFSVEKQSADGSTSVKIQQVDGEARVREISRMLGGSERTALKHASELVGGEVAA